MDPADRVPNLRGFDTLHPRRRPPQADQPRSKRYSLKKLRSGGLRPPPEVCTPKASLGVPPFGNLNKNKDSLRTPDLALSVFP